MAVGQLGATPQLQHVPAVRHWARPFPTLSCKVLPVLRLTDTSHEPGARTKGNLAVKAPSARPDTPEAPQRGVLVLVL